MEEDSGDSVTFEEVITEAHGQLNSQQRVDTQELMTNLQEFGEVPEDATTEHIDMLLDLIYQNVPVKLNNDKHNEAHFATINILLMFLKDERVMDRFKPSSSQVQRLKLARLV